MTRTRPVARWLFVATVAAGPAAAQELFIFPQQGQDQAQQDQDRGACHVWAVNQTGFDPTLASTTPPSSREAPQGGLVIGCRSNFLPPSGMANQRGPAGGTQRFSGAPVPVREGDARLLPSSLPGSSWDVAERVEGRQA